MARGVQAVLLLLMTSLQCAALGAVIGLLLGYAWGCAHPQSHGALGDTTDDARWIFAMFGAMYGAPGGYVGGLVGSATGTRAGWAVGGMLGGLVVSIPFALGDGAVVALILAAAGGLNGLVIGRSLPGGQMVAIRTKRAWLIDPACMAGWPAWERCKAAAPALALFAVPTWWAVQTIWL